MEAVCDAVNICTREELAAYNEHEGETLDLQDHENLEQFCDYDMQECRRALFQTWLCPPSGDECL